MGVIQNNVVAALMPQASKETREYLVDSAKYEIVSEKISRFLEKEGFDCELHPSEMFAEEKDFKFAFRKQIHMWLFGNKLKLETWGRIQKKAVFLGALKLPFALIGGGGLFAKFKVEQSNFLSRLENHINLVISE